MNRLHRRILILAMGGVSLPGAGMALAPRPAGEAPRAGSATPVQQRRPYSGQSDSDPNDGAGHGRPRTGNSDSDPRDGAGRGRATTGNSDSDPRDAAGRGRPTTGNSDSDPRDGAGRGRPTTGRSDSDPNDAAGRGRRCHRIASPPATASACTRKTGSRRTARRGDPHCSACPASAAPGLISAASLRAMRPFAAS